MKRVIRNKVYETNSSASHSITVAEGDVFDRAFDLENLRQGKIVLVNEASGYDEFYRYYKPENILAFLIMSEIEAQECFGEKTFSSDPAISALHCDRYQDFDILPIIRQHVHAVDSGISFLEKEYRVVFEYVVKPIDILDFDTSNLSPASGYMANHDVLKRLLFNSGSFVQTEEENSYAYNGMSIPTDKGEPEVFDGYDRLGNLEEFIDALEAMAEANSGSEEAK